MSRRRSWIAIVVILIVATALAAAALPREAEAATTKSKLRSAKLALRQSKDRLKSAEAALSAAVSADTGLGAIATTDPAAAPTPTPTATTQATATPEPPLTVDELKARVTRARHVVSMWKQRVRRLARHYQLERDMARWEREHDWMKLIEVAAARYHVSANGMYRMMMRESGGERYAGSSSPFKGLFQYWTGSWNASWNPWRNDSIYDGSAQIFATAYAIHRGMGPQMWTTTFASLY